MYQGYNFGLKRNRRYYSHNGVTFERSIADPDSKMWRVWEFVEKHGGITRLEFYTVHGPNGLSRVDDINYWKDRIVAYDDRGNRLWFKRGTGRITGVRSGFGTYFWCAAVNAGFLQRSNNRREGYMVYEKGPRYDEWNNRIRFNNWKREVA
jgi:hypothetical protein